MNNYAIHPLQFLQGPLIALTDRSHLQMKPLAIRQLQIQQVCHTVVLAQSWCVRIISMGQCVPTTGTTGMLKLSVETWVSTLRRMVQMVCLGVMYIVIQVANF